MWREIQRPEVAKEGTMAAVGRHWHTQVMDRGRTWFTTANAAIATSKPLRGSDGFPTNNTEQCALRGIPCAHQACAEHRPYSTAVIKSLPGLSSCWQRGSML